MRAILRVSKNPSEWFENANDASVVRRDAKIILNSVVLTSDLRNYRDLLRNLHDVTNESSKNLIASFLSSAILGKSAPGRVSDFNVGFWDESLITLDSLIDNDEIEEITDTRNPELKIGEGVEAAFSRTVGPLLAYAEDVVIVDPYAGSALVSRDANRYWLVGKILEKQVRTLHVYTTVPTKESTEAPEAIATLRRNLTTLLEKHAGFSGKVTVHIYESNPSKFHHRRIALGIGDKKICLILEKGTDIFGAQEINEVTTLATLSFEGFKSHLDGVKSALVRQAVIEL